MDGGAWKAAVHGVAKSRTGLSDFPFTFHFHALEKEMATTPVSLPGESQGWGSLVGCHLWGRTESDTTEVTYTRGDRPPSRVEAKNPALLPGCDGYLLELTEWTQGSQAS